MTADRKSKILLWELMLQLEEAGGEDICSLLNELQGLQSYYGSGADLVEYLEALSILEKQGELRVREYHFDDRRMVYGDVVVGADSRPPSAFEFDVADRMWKWRGEIRQMVEIAYD